LCCKYATKSQKKSQRCNQATLFLLAIHYYLIEYTHYFIFTIIGIRLALVFRYGIKIQKNEVWKDKYMKVALSVFKDSISTVFDVAQQLLVLEMDRISGQKRTMLKIDATDPVNRAAQLSEQGINVLICGAISQPLQASILARGIAVYPFVRGAVKDVIVAYQNGRLTHAVYALPGCRGRGLARLGRRRNRGMRCRGR
jgi:predicted Fe-Mo cluster-binding NifX family protein